jgi:urea transport system permease protein
MSLVGAVYGTLLVNAGKTFFSESFPEAWLFLMAGLFIGVTMAFPMGLAGLWESHVVSWWKGRREALRQASVQPRPLADATPVAPATSTASGGVAPAPDALPDGVSRQGA